MDGLRGAQFKVEVAMAWFTDRDLFRELNRCISRGVKVCVLLYDDDINRTSGIDWSSLATAGGYLYWYNPLKGTMHHKFCVVDDRHCFFGSYNWTNAALTLNNESILVLESENLAAGFSDEISKLLASPYASPHVGVRRYFNGPGLVLHPGLENLRREIMLLELEITELEAQISELESKLNKYEAILRASLSDLLLEQLRLQQELAQIRAKITMKRVYEEEAKEWQARYEETKSSLNEDKKVKTEDLSSADFAEMKKMYREAIFAIHPDKFHDDADKYAAATEYSQQLIDAFKSSDYTKVKEIWERVKNGWIFDSDILVSDNWEVLSRYLDKQRQKHAALVIKLSELQGNEVLLASENYTNFDDYVDICRIQLQNNIEHIKKEIKDIGYE